METTFAFFQNKAVTAHREHTDGPPSVLHAGDPDNLRACMRRLLHKVCVTELILRERLNICDGLAAQALRKELDLVAFHVLDNKDIEALEEGEGDIVDSVAEDRLLNEEDVAVCFLNLLAHVEQILTALLDDLVHLPVVIDHDRVVHLQES